MNVNFNYPSIRQNRTEQNRTKIAVKAQSNPSFGMVWSIKKHGKKFPKNFSRALSDVIIRKHNPNFDRVDIIATPISRKFKISDGRIVKHSGYRFNINLPGQPNNSRQTQVLLPNKTKKREIIKWIERKISAQQDDLESRNSQSNNKNVFTKIVNYVKNFFS